jgi:hypothetical protein
MKMRLPDLLLRRGAVAATLAGAALLALGALAASCVEAVDAGGYSDALAETCALIDRCYGERLTDCTERVTTTVLGFDDGGRASWLELAADMGCLDSCNTVRSCLDFPQICKTSLPLGECQLDEDCCGFSRGEASCLGGTCCRALGALCADDHDCCPNTGSCEEGHCGGVVCAAAGAPCVNDFQCCTGRCDDGDRCGNVTCSPEGLACDLDAECCDGLCDPTTRKCKDPACAQSGESCKSADDCCDEGFVCNTQGEPGGVCSPGACNPKNSDCFVDTQCCSGLRCVKPYNLCGECAGQGDLCGDGVPCCDGSMCAGAHCQVVPPP